MAEDTLCCMKGWKDHIPLVCAVKIFLQGRTMKVSHPCVPVIIQFSLQPSMLDPRQWSHRTLSDNVITDTCGR